MSWTPYFSTVLDAWAKRDHPNLLYLFYEDMKKVGSYRLVNQKPIDYKKHLNFLINWQDLPTEIKRIASFLGKTLTEEQIEKLVDHVSMDKFSKNESVNMDREIKAGLANEGYTFVRKGMALHSLLQ